MKRVKLDVNQHLVRGKAWSYISRHVRFNGTVKDIDSIKLIIDQEVINEASKS